MTITGLSLSLCTQGGGTDKGNTLQAPAGALVAERLQHPGSGEKRRLVVDGEVPQKRDNLVVYDGDSGVRAQLLQPVRVDAGLVLHLREPGELLQLGHAGVRVRVRVLLRPLLQELQAVLVRADDVQGLGGDAHRLADQEVGQGEVLARGGVHDPPLVGELAGHVAAVALRQLEDGRLVVHGVEGYDEAPALVLRLAVDHLALKAQDLAGERHQLHEVHLRGLRLDVMAAQDRVLRVADAVVGRRVELLVGHRLLGDVDPAGELVDAHEVLVELLRELVALVEHDLAAPDVDGAADHAVLGHVEVGVRGEHAGVAARGVLLEQRSLLLEQRPVGAPRVAGVGLVDLYGVVAKVVVHDEVDAAAVQRVVVPVALEAQHLPVVQQELLQLVVDDGTADRELAEHLLLHGGARRRDAALLGRLLELVRLLPRVLHHGLVLAEVDAVLVVEPAREAVAAGNVVGPAVDVDLLADAHVVRAEEARAAALRDAVALQEGALRDAGVLDLGLRDARGSVLHVEHDGHVPVAAVLLRRLGHVLLEEAVEAQHLLLVLQPGRRKPGLAHVLGHHVLHRGRRRDRRVRHRRCHAPARVLHRVDKLRDVLVGGGAHLEVHRALQAVGERGRLVVMVAPGHRRADLHDTGHGLRLHQLGHLARAGWPETGRQ
mmetsp:Transcript_22594/g.59687  ORF Transcript_22594/g.59687 Transcript_22594/m.59687 type:complete len:660 (+) Transcript_22594:186-2165(+)